MTERQREVIGVLLMAFAVLVFLSLISFNPLEEITIPKETKNGNYLGYFGVWISHFLIKLTFGWGSLFLPFIFGIIGWSLFTNRPPKFYIRQSIYILGIAIWTGLIIWVFIEFSGGPKDYTASGYFISSVGRLIYDFIGGFGLFIILLTSILLLFSGYFRYSIKNGLIIIKEFIDNKFRELITKFNQYKDSKTDKIEPEINVPQDSEVISDIVKPEPTNEEPPAIEQEPLTINRPEKEDFEIKEGNFEENGIEIDEVTKIEEGDLDSAEDRRVRFLQYKLPPLDLLYNPPEIREDMSEEILNDKAKELEHALETFGVLGRVVRISPGPVITLFEVEPSEGVRVNKFVNLADDLARIMKAHRVRIIAPIPGSKSVGIELPNANPAIVFIRNILNSKIYIEAESKLTLAIGRTTTGEAFTFDLGKMPHLLIAGATGAGKSVCINTIIISILYKARPDEVKFIMIDPKRIELSTYRELIDYHLITSPNIEEYVMTTPENAVAVLHSALAEMERRYDVFSRATVRNLGEYHNKCKLDSSLEKMPFIVVLIDELADLMQTSGKEIEDPIARLAQMARAVGIHLIVATQRPSVDVITGVIKANFPARIAFQVSSKVDSRTIIDQMGAEKLLGKGDMLYLPPGQSSPKRLHNAFITLDEIEKVIGFIRKQPKPEEVMLPETAKKMGGPEIQFEEGRDELLADAAKLVIQLEQASVSLLQRRFRIGYSRAGRLVDELEAMGIISGYSGSKARDVLVDESYLEQVGLN